MSCSIRNTLPLHNRARRQVALGKIHELQKIVENWDSKDLGQCCDEFIRGTVAFAVLLSILI